MKSSHSTKVTKPQVADLEHKQAFLVINKNALCSFYFSMTGFDLKVETSIPIC
jgi:hypothetical protein